MEKSVTLILCVKNHLHEHTIPCLDSILQNTSHSYKLVFVDDGSTDGTARYLATIPGARVIRFSKSKGTTIARNEALARSELTDLMVFLDNDTRVPLGWLTILDEESQKDRVGVVAGIPSNETARLDRKPAPDGLLDFNQVGGGTTAITRDCIETVGLLDEWLWASQDTDFCYRAKLAGFRVCSTPRLVIKHFVGGTRGKTKRDRRKIYIAAIRFRRKYRRYRDFFTMPPLYPFGT